MQVQMQTTFGDVKVGTMVQDAKSDQHFRKETWNIGRQVGTNEPYYFDANDKVYVDVVANPKQVEMLKAYMPSLPMRGVVLQVTA